MNEAAARLASGVTRWVVLASLLTTALLLGLIPELLLLDPREAAATKDRELLLLAVAGLSALAVVVARLRRHRYVLRALALGSRSVDPHELDELGQEPGRLARRWLVPHVLAEAALITTFKPDELDSRTATSLGLLGGVVAGAVSLLLYVLVRSRFLRAMELSPPDVMRELVESAERTGRAQARIPRRLRTAVATPVALVAVGTALIASAHVRRADAVAREATARALARAALERSPGIVPTAGLDAAVDRARELGFVPLHSDAPRPYSAVRGDHGLTVVTTPLDEGSVVVRFHRSTVPVLSTESILVAALTVIAAAALGGMLGRAHTLDVQHATEGVRLLGTEAVLRGGRLQVRPPRFPVVAELEEAIRELADRFRVFAEAQERSILAREAATRMRGLFFASVSHDLKSPLNAILGFAALVRLEPLTPGQVESLDVIERRGRELLALIETILDAARVEAGQLALVLEATRTDNLLREAFGKARDLGSDPTCDLSADVEDGAENLRLDRVRMARALATLVAFAVRSGRAGHLRVRVRRSGADHVTLEVPIAGRRTARDLSRLLSSAGRPGGGEHRGLSLGLSLARSIIELHGGALDAADGAGGTPVFRVRLPGPVS